MAKGTLKKLIRITFIKSPTGAFGLAYSAGDTIPLEEEKARELMELGFAIPAKEGIKPKKENAKAKHPTKETR